MIQDWLKRNAKRYTDDLGVDEDSLTEACAREFAIPLDTAEEHVQEFLYDD